MEHLIQILGQMIPDTKTAFGVKILVAGIVGTFMGLMVMASGIDGMLVHGGAIAACGVALTVLSVRSFARERRHEEAGPIEQERTREAEARRSEEQANRVREQKRREAACDGHDYYLDDGSLNCSVASWLCRKCGAVRDTPS